MTAPAYRRRKIQKPSFKDLYDATALALFENWGRAVARTFELDTALSRAGIAEHPVVYASRLLFTVVIAILFVSTPLAMLAVYVSVNVFIQLMLVVLASVTPLLIFGLGLSYPSMVASSRKTTVENELPFFMSYAATMARGGVSIDKVIERVAELKIFKAMRDEARRMLSKIRFFGADPVTAIDEVVRYHPSNRFRDIMLGYITTLKTGGDTVHYLELRTQELFSQRTREIRELTERLGSFLELYIVIGVIASITLFVFFAVTGAVSSAAAGAGAAALRLPPMNLSMPALYNFVVLPLLGMMVLLMAHYSQPRTPIGHPGPYIVLLVTIPMAAIVFVVTLWTTGGFSLFSGQITLNVVNSATISMTVAVLTASIPPWLVWMKDTRGMKGLVRSTADFLRDMAEVRKTGLSPEKCFISLSTRDYRNLTPVVKRAAAALSLGMSLERALAKALRGVREWFVVAVFRLLADSIVVGGGSPEIVDTLARFTQSLAESEELLRRRLKYYVVLPYFGVILLASTPIMIMNLLVSAAGTAGSTIMAPMLLVLGIGTLINAYVMGLVAGKTSEMSVAAGFKHAALMSLIAAATAVLTTTSLG